MSRKSDVWEWALFGWPITIVTAIGFVWFFVKIIGN